MLDDESFRGVDLSTIDIRALTTVEWEALKREVVQRAQAERARALRAVVKWLRFRWTRTRLEGEFHGTELHLRGAVRTALRDPG